MKRLHNKTATVLGYLGFFGLMVVAVMTAVMIYTAVENMSKAVIAVTMICVILALAAICTVIDALRRAYTMNRPVKEILDATDRIALGDFGVELVPRHARNRFDEYDCIMENLNKMTEKLSKSAVLATDFISNVSHEFKTPLAVIRNYAALLKDADLPENKRVEYAEVLEHTSVNLSNLVANVLQLNKLENGQIELKRESVRLDGMLEETILGFEDAIDRKNITVDCELGEGTINTAPEYLKIVWNNLISNAVKFTPEGGKISVKAVLNNGAATVSVSDTGCGISKESGRRIFDKFYQGDTSHAEEGNGLGLALVKKVIDIIGGEITVESEEGVGSTFTVKIKDDGNE